MKRLYAIMAAISTIVRQFCLPNPFKCFGDNAILINWIAEFIMHIVAFSLVGLVYRNGECPPLGSLLYLVSYAALTGVLALMGVFSFAWWWVLIIIVVMIGIGVVLINLWRRLGGETW